MSQNANAIPNPTSLIRLGIQALQAYVPGEQPKIKRLIKLNTNENPYPPSPEVLRTVRKATDGRLRLYPNPTAQRLRERLAELHDCKPENIMVGNGSDELLALTTRAFVEPCVPFRSLSSEPRNPFSKSTVQYFTPSYSLYPVLAAIHGAYPNPVPLGAGFALPHPRRSLSGSRFDLEAALTFITTPNAPSGRAYTTQELSRICRLQKGVVVLDEAYVDFAEENALSLALKFPHVLVARTFSKAYSLCFQRIGYLIGHPDLIAALDKIRDSYNVNGLGQIAAEATLAALPYYRANFKRIISTRNRLSRELRTLGFKVLPSQANFILVRPPTMTAQRWLEELRMHKILVRWFSYPEVRDFIRITIGTDRETDALLRAVKRILK
ncbi:MAG: histidinol-phosphate transaminase [Pedosphaera sp.]|nr:histidinol-phosphate transaminase [Pedosphaera sp.]